VAVGHAGCREISLFSESPPNGALHGHGMHPWPSSLPVPVQAEQLPFVLLGMQWPLAQALSEVQ
jgi:hypothetical protein